MILNINDQQVDQILNALGHRPYIESAPLINELVKQVQVQKAQPQFGTAIPGGQVLGAGATLNGAGAEAAANTGASPAQ